MNNMQSGKKTEENANPYTDPSYILDIYVYKFCVNTNLQTIRPILI